MSIIPYFSCSINLGISKIVSKLFKASANFGNNISKLILSNRLATYGATKLVCKVLIDYEEVLPGVLLFDAFLFDHS